MKTFWIVSTATATHFEPPWHIYGGFTLYADAVGFVRRFMNENLDREVLYFGASDEPPHGFQGKMGKCIVVYRDKKDQYPSPEKTITFYISQHGILDASKDA